MKNEITREVEFGRRRAVPAARRRRPTATLLSFLLAGGAIAAFGCAHVELDPGADQVGLVMAGHESMLERCQRVSKTRASVLDHVGVIDRSPEKVEHELSVLARNAALAAGADHVIAESEVENGAQTFGLYRCGGSSPDAEE